MPMRVEETPFNLERLQREVNILLLSDLHYDVDREKHKEEWMKGPFVNDRILESLEKDPSPWEPDMVIVAGDLVNHNKTANYDHYTDLIGKLTHKFPNLKNAYFSTPGNHDINRENIVAVFPYLYQLQQADPLLKIDNSFTSNPVIDAIYTIARKSITTDKELAKALVKFEKEYFKTYLNEQNKLYKKTLHPHQREELFSEIQTVYYSSILGITVLSLNTSFFCNLSQTGQDRNNLFLIRDLVGAIESKLKSIAHGPVVTFMHHPYYYLHESEHIAPVSYEVEDSQNNFTKLVKTSDLILSGHVHGDLHDPTLLQQYAYMITNGTSYTTDSFEGKCYPYTYALIKINKQLRKFSLRKFKYKAVDGSGNKYAFQCINRDPCKSYPFFEREHVEETTIETEKIRVLYYFRGFYCEKIHTSFHFFIYQLRLYNKALTDPSIDYDFQEISHPHSTVLVTSIAFQDNLIWIYRMDNDSYVPDIIKVLSEQANGFPEKCTVYFSIKMELLFKNRTPLSEQIENLQKTFPSIVMSMKNEKVSINLLYH